MTKRTTLTTPETEYLEQSRLGRLATVDSAGRPQVTPVGMWRIEDGVLEIRGRDLKSTRKFRNVAATGQAAFVVDDVAPGDGWNPRAVMLEGPTEAVTDTAGEPVIRMRPDRIASWGLNTSAT